MPSPFAAALLTFAALLAPLAADDPTGDLKTLQGTWEGTIAADSDIPIALEIKGEKITATITTPEGDEVRLEGKVKLDEKTDPKQLDFVDFTGPDGGSMPDNLGIYKLDGETLTICAGGHDNPRPKDFKAGGEAMTLTLKKAKTRKID